MVDPLPVSIALRTDRLVVESLRPAHLDRVVAYCVRNREHLAPWEPRRQPAYFTREGQRRAIEESEAAAARDEARRFVAFESGGDRVVAAIQLSQIVRGIAHSAVIGYSVDAEREGRGYATEATGAVVRFAFGNLNLHRLHTSYHPTNERSGSVLRKLGFVVEGYARDHLFIDAAWRDSILVGLTNPDWRPAPLGVTGDASREG